MEIFVGTSGFSYKEWKGSFYPPKLPAKQMLAYYAERLPSVEINNTFYRMPTPDVLAGWVEQVPATFRFVVKASRTITHFKRLKPEAVDAACHLLDVAASLEDRLGVVLFQLPPNFKLNLEILEVFLASLPEGTPFAFEFRHPSWQAPEVDEVLSRFSVAKVLVDSEENPLGELTKTADWGYLRLRGVRYSAAEIDRWCERVATSGWKRAYVFFKHEDEGTGPRFARSFLDALEARVEE